LLAFTTPVQAHNTIVVFSFVAAGLTAFCLCHTFTHRYWPSIIGGCVFTFSQYHFAHADGHLQLVSLEWIPAFALAWYVLLRKPSLKTSTGTAISLALVLACDFYYFAYCVLYAIVVTAYEAFARKDPVFVLRRCHRPAMLVFLALTIISCGPLIAGLVRLNAVDPLLGSHDAASFSTDLLGALVPGGHWRFAELTRSFWDSLPGNIQESSVDIGVAVAAALMYCIVHRAHPLVRRAGVWWWILAGFWLLSLGPVLHIWGAPHARVPMPYAGVQTLVPFLDLSGVPARMMVMVTLAAAVLTSVGYALLFEASLRARLIACGLLVLMAVEYVPRAIPTTSPQIPAYVSALASIQEPGGLLDLVSGYFEDRPFGSVTGSGIALYYQTLHHRPMASGYIARVPSSAWATLQREAQLVDDRDYGTLCREYDLRYVVVPTAQSLTSARLLLIDADADAKLFDLAPDGTCVPT
jgi:hypothetical protein